MIWKRNRTWIGQAVYDPEEDAAVAGPAARRGGHGCNLGYPRQAGRPPQQTTSAVASPSTRGSPHLISPARRVADVVCRCPCFKR